MRMRETLAFVSPRIMLILVTRRARIMQRSPLECDQREQCGSIAAEPRSVERKCLHSVDAYLDMRDVYSLIDQNTVMQRPLGRKRNAARPSNHMAKETHGKTARQRRDGCDRWVGGWVSDDNKTRHLS